VARREQPYPVHRLVVVPAIAGPIRAGCGLRIRTTVFAKPGFLPRTITSEVGRRARVPPPAWRTAATAYDLAKPTVFTLS